MQVATGWEDWMLGYCLAGVAVVGLQGGKELFLLLCHFPHTNENESLFIFRQLWWFIDLSKMRSQHQTKQSRPSLAQIQQAHCQVCFVSFDRAIPKRLEEGLQILFCSHCHITVHKGCYDFQANLTVLSQQVSQFLCERCKHCSGKQVHCLVCFGQEGAMKPIGEQQYVHVYCGLVHNDIDVISYYPTISFRKSLQYQELSNICEICIKRNAHDQCAEESCRRKVHTYCAKTTYVKLAAENDQPHSWNHHISAGNHGNFDLSEEIISYELYSDEIELVLKEINQAEIDLPMKQSLKRKIHKEYIEELRGKRKSTKKLRRGGFSYVLCSQHESTAYCVCLSKEQGEMVLCECCFEWYHQKCINYNADEPEERFICQYCKVFYEFKRKAIEEVKGGRADADISKIQLPLKFSVADCMWLIRVIDNRIRGGQATKMLKQLSKYPLKSSCLDSLIRQQNRNKLNALTQTFVQQLLDSSQIVSNLRPRPVLSLRSDGEAVVVGENVEYNLRLRKVVQVLVGLGVPAESISGLQAELDFKQRAVSDQYETIIELSKSTEPYQEVPILKQKAQAFNFIDIVQKIQQKIPIPYQSLLDAYQKTLNNSHVPPYMQTIISQKITEIQPLFKQISETINENPQNLQKIISVVQQLEEQFIESPPEYLQLKSQRKFIQDLHLYYIKYNPSQIQEEKSIAEQIELLLGWTNLKPSQELVQIVNSYRPVSSTCVWKRTPDLLKKCQSTVIQYELKQVLKRKVCKQDRLLQIMQNAASTDLQYHSEEVKNFILGWIAVKEKINSSIAVNLQTVQDYETISELLKTTNAALNDLDNLGVRIEQDGKSSLFSQLRTRQQQLEQLQIIFTEAQLQKNPLTIAKLLPSLPKNNPLVKQYNSLKKQQSTLMNKFTTFLAKISQRIQLFKADSKKQRKDQIRENSEKPSLSQTRELIESFKQSQCDFSRQIKELTRILANSLQIANKASRYCQEKHDFSNIHSLQELTNRRKQIDELRRKILTVAQLNLKTQLTDLYHLEISLRMKNALLTPNLQQDKIGFLLKVAEEENLTHQKLYIELKDRFQTKNQKSKEVNQVKQLQNILNGQASRDTTPNYSVLASYRRGLPLMDPADIKIKNSYVQQIVQKNKVLRNKITNILSGKTKVEFQDVKPLYLQALKNPFTIPDLTKLGQQINKTWDIIKRWKQNTHKWHSLSQSIFVDYQKSIFTVEQIEIVRRELKSNEDEINHLKFMVESFSTQTLQQVEEVVQKIQGNPVIKDTPVCLAAELQYLQYWIKLLSVSRQSKTPLSYQKLRKLILDAYNLLQRTLKRGEEYQQISPIIIQLQRYLAAVKAHLKQYPKYNPSHSLVQGFIDLEEFYFDNEDQPELADLVPLYKPFQDMPKFRVRNLQKVQTKRDELTLKRSHSKFDQIRASSDKNIQLSLSSQSQMQEQARDVPLTVSDNQRRKIKEIFLRNIKKNPQLRKFGDCENEVKMIENQIFGEWHNDIVKYFEMSEQFQKLFIKLINCPNISNKIIKKKFQFKFINLLVGNLQKIDELQNMVINKLKEQEAVKTINETVTLPVPELPSQPAIQTVNPVKFDQTAREDVKKEMRLIKESKESKQSKHKKKKHHKHKDRSNSPDAKFSSDSEKELPKYIENEYNKEQEKVPVKIDTYAARVTQSPLRYDPEQEQLQKRQTIFPRGSAIKLKTCEAQIQTKKRGRAEFSIDLYTDQEHRKVMELVDPGFTKLPIRKQKNESDILPYINKSRKKYRFIVGWFEASNPLENELLRELAQEATERKRVFGWQCEHIKLHMMSVKQLVTIPKINIPSKVTTQEAADSLGDDRMIFVLQYPERLYELKDQYKSFQNLECRTELYNVNVPMPVIESKPINDYYHNYTVPTIEPLVKPVFKEPEVVYETWGAEPNVIPPPPPPPVQTQQQYGIHPRVNQARMQYGFGNYSPILTDSQDNQEDKNQRQDLADNLLNSLDSAKILNQPPVSRDKPQNQPYQPQYYGGYNQYQAIPPQRPMPAQNRWNPYQPMGQPQPQHVYNPLNPMAPKFSNPMNPMVPSQQQMGQNPMNQGQMPQNPMNQGQMGQQGMMGMYKNPMMGQRGGQMGMGGPYYDPRYPGYQHQQ